MKKIQLVLMLFCLCSFCFFTIMFINAEGANVKQPAIISIDGKVLESVNDTFNTDSNLLVPIRSVFEELGAAIGWAAKTKTVTITYGDITASLKIGDHYAIIKGETVKLDSSSIMYKGNTMVPISFITQCLGIKAQYNEQSNCIEIITKKDAVSEQPAPDTKFELVDVRAKSEKTIEAAFSHKVEKASAENADNYIIKYADVQMTISGVKIDDTGTKVIITTSDAQRAGVVYIVTVQNVRDLWGNLPEKAERKFASMGLSTGLRMQNINAKGLEIIFDEALNKNSAENTSNYFIYLKSDKSKTIPVSKAELDSSGKIVRITFSQLPEIAKIYKIAANNLITSGGVEIPEREGGFGGAAN